ncbi:MAG: extracellular solute-binding protein [Candidatus Promineifilaceae bacterium]
MSKKIAPLSLLILILALALAACGQAGAPTAVEQATDAPEPAADATEPADVATEPAAATEPADEPASDKVQIRWFCCLGTGDDPAQVPTEQEVVADFNAAHPDIELVLEIVDYDAARDALSTQIASGNPPDIVGPVGVSGSEAYHGQWLDLTDLIAAHNYDLSQFDQGAVDFYKVGGEGQVGLPFAIFPSALFYQREMFDEAGLEYPPHAYGDPYVMPDGSEVEWTFETLRELALILTVDENGNDATSPDFDATKIVQYGYEPTFQDARAVGSYFGAGTFVAEDGVSAQVPPAWADAYRWLYSGMWEDHFIPTAAVIQTDEFGQGNPFNAGRVAMTLTHLWYTCCLADAGGNWDVAAVPSHNGVTTANFNADTFRIFKTTEHPDEAFQALAYLLGEGSEKLVPIYGAFPAQIDAQDAFFQTKAEEYPQDVDWQVFTDGIAYADNPSFEGYMPNYNEAFDYLVTFLSNLRATEGLDMDTEIAKLETDLRAIFEKQQ